MASIAPWPQPDQSTDPFLRGFLTKKVPARPATATRAKRNFDMSIHNQIRPLGQGNNISASIELIPVYHCVTLGEASDVVAEFGLCQLPSATDVGRLLKWGIPFEALEGDEDYRGFIAKVDHVIFLQGSLFEFARYQHSDSLPVKALIIVGRNELGDPADLLVRSIDRSVRGVARAHWFGWRAICGRTAGR